MRVLVTGGAGFIGSHIVERLQRTAAVRVLDNLRTGFQRNIEGHACEFIEASVTDRTAVRAAMQGVDYVFHLAAMISVPESMSKPTECVGINTTGTLVVLEEAARAKVRKLCFSSSAAIYGDHPAVPKVETMLPEPRSPYAITKLDGEYYCDMFQREGLVETVSLRYFNVFGPRQNPRGAYAAVVPAFIQAALAGRPLTIFGDGGQTRDFVSVEDVVSANVHAAMKAGMRGVFNVARGARITINALAEKIVALTGTSSTIVRQAGRSGDVRESAASVEKIRATGFEPAAEFDEALTETVKWFAANACEHVASK